VLLESGNHGDDASIVVVLLVLVAVLKAIAIARKKRT
jgi:hypothetical protein